jgi:hypothetical protein
MLQTNPNPFSNWGDWLIQRSTGFLGDFRMSICISLLRTGVSQGWIQNLNELDVQKILARYKEHVTFWRISPDVIQRELVEFAGALPDPWRWNPNTILAIYQSVPAIRYPVEYQRPDHQFWSS